MIAVRELLESVLPEGTRVVAGEAALVNEVTWAVSMRPTSPAFTGLRGGELALVSAARLAALDERLSFAEVVETLATARVAALAILGEIPEDATAAAERLSLPLLQLPEGSIISDVEQQTTRTIFERRAELYQEGQEIHRRLAELALSGQGLDTIIGALAQIVGKTVVLEDSAGGVRAMRARGLSDETVTSLLQSTRAAVSRWASQQSVPAAESPAQRFAHGDLARLVAPVLARRRVAYYISIAGPSFNLGERDRQALMRAAAACAIHLSREQAALAARDELHGTFLEELLNGSSQSEREIVARAQRLGYSLEQPHVALALQLLAPEVESPDERLAALVEEELKRRHVVAPFAARGEAVLILHPVVGASAENTWRPLAADLRQALLRRLPGRQVSMGIGCVRAGVEGARLSCREAEESLLMGNRLLGTGHLTAFTELGLYRLLLSMRGSAELRSFHQAMLGPLIAYDERSGGELLRTLEAFFRAKASPTQAAEALHVHRNTLLYRLQRIQEIAEVDLDDPESRLRLHLALRIHEVLSA